MRAVPRARRIRLALSGGFSRRAAAFAFASALAVGGAAAPEAAAQAGGVAARPSHPAFAKCKWERFDDATVGLAAWVQRCDYGFRKIDFVAKGASLAIRYSDGGEPDPLIDMFDLKQGESAADGVRRIFSERTDPALAKRCVLAPYRARKTPAGALRYTFVPNAAYRKELKAKARSDEVGDPPCGDWGDAPDGIQYFEAWPKQPARKFAFVRIGQDEPLFDEQTLAPLAPGPARTR
jgi:hypothetical protein